MNPDYWRSADIPALEVLLYDSGTEHTFSRFGYWTFTGETRPKTIRYSKDYGANFEASVFTDEFILHPARKKDTSPFKIAWLNESRSIIPEIYEEIARKPKVVSNFDLFVTHDLEMVNRFKNAAFCPIGGSWCGEAEIRSEVTKSHLVSMILSDKKTTRGHRIRHQVYSELVKSTNVDFFGSGANKPFRNKSEALGGYLYSIAVLNDDYPMYFTEIVNDCFLLKTIPIIWGTRTLNEMFDSRGLLFWSNLAELSEILEFISSSDYESRREAVNINFEIARDLSNTDDNLRVTIYNELGI
jgi:hypothetical protein